MKEYFIEKTWKGQYGEEIYFAGIIEVHEDVIKSVDDEWRKIFYPSIVTSQGVAEHIAYNIIVNNARLSQLDGFACFPDDYARIKRTI